MLAPGACPPGSGRFDRRRRLRRRLKPRHRVSPSASPRSDRPRASPDGAKASTLPPVARDAPPTSGRTEQRSAHNAPTDRLRAERRELVRTPPDRVAPDAQRTRSRSPAPAAERARRCAVWEQLAVASSAASPSVVGSIMDTSTALLGMSGNGTPFRRVPRLDARNPHRGWQIVLTAVAGYSRGAGGTARCAAVVVRRARVADGRYTTPLAPRGRRGAECKVGIWGDSTVYAW